MGIITGGVMAAGAVDTGNSPTFELRPGLLLGQKTADGTWSNYAAGNTDGTEVAAGVLITSLRMQDMQGVNQQRFYGILVGGPVQAAKILGLDLMARQQMDKFQFDDPLNYPGAHWYPFRRFQTKTASYSIVANDNFSHFDNLGATGAVTFTLPAIGVGYYFGFTAEAAQNLLVTSNEGANIITFNNLVANTVAYQTGGSIIGGSFHIYSNPAGTKWIVEQIGSNTMTVS